MRIVQLLEQPSHNEAEVEEIVEYLKTFEKIKDQIDILNKIQIKRVNF